MDNIIVRDVIATDLPGVATTYTVKFELADGTTIKDAVVTDCNSNEFVAATEEQMATFYLNDKKYVYVSGNQTITTVENAESNVITLVFAEYSKVNYSVKAMAGETELATIIEGSDWPETEISFGYSQYLAKDGTLYKSAAQGSNPWWGKTFTLTEEDYAATISYTAQDVTGVVFCKEAEDIDGLSVVSGGNTDIRASNRKGAYATDAITITTLEPGVYKIYGATYGNAGVTFSIMAGDATVFTLATAGNPVHTAGEEFTINTTTDIVLQAGGNGGNSPKTLDYIIIQKTGDAEADPYAGAHYLYSATDGKFISRGADWGTRAIADNYGVPANVIKSDESYTIKFLDNELYLNAGGYTDGGLDNDNTLWTIEEVEGGFLLKNNGNSSYAKITNGFVNIDGTADDATVWTFKTAEEQKAIVDAKILADHVAIATAAGYEEVTDETAFASMLADNYVGQNVTATYLDGDNLNSNGAGNWTVTGVRKLGDNWATYVGGGNGVAESFSAAVTLTKELTGLAAGIYKVTMNGFFRQGNNAVCWANKEAGFLPSNVYLQAGSYATPLKAWAEKATKSGDTYTPDNTIQAADAFANGDYVNELYTYVGEEGTLTLSVNIPNFINWAGWACYNNVQLTYYVTKDNSVKVSDITLNETSASLTTGDVLTLTATVAPEDATDSSLTWTSSDESVATVNNGVVSALKAGTATITAAANDGSEVSAACTVTVADAAVPSLYSTEIADATDYYIMNAATGKFLGGDNSWGTQASLIKHGIAFTAALNDGKYTLDSHTYNSATSHFFSGTYVDGGATSLYITSLGDGKFSISTADGSAFVTASVGSTVVANTAANANSSLAQWYFLSKNDRDKMLAAATAQNPVDATYYIPNASFSRNQNTSYNENRWTVTAKNSNLAANENCAESYRSGNGFNVTQTISLPNGNYRFRAQGFYRQDGSDTENKAVFFVGDQEIEFPERTGTENSMALARASFDAGLYYTEWVDVTVTDYTLTLGARTNNTMLWCIWDNFELEMTGYVPVTDITASIDNAEFEVAQTATITAAPEPATASFNALTFTSSNEEVATVSAEGVVTGVAAGEATITIAAEMENVTKTIDVTVVTPAVVPSSITLNETEIALDATTTTFTLTAEVGPEGANQAVTFASSDETVATVSAEGVVTAVLPGTATITVTSAVKADVTTEATVTVTFPEAASPAPYYVNNGATRTNYSADENLIKNGAFEYPNGYYGWKNGAGGDMAAANFNIVTDGDNHYLQAKKSEGGGSANSIQTAWPIEAGKTYVFGYRIKANDNGNSEFHVVSLTNTIGTETAKISDNNTPITTQWTEVKYQFTNTEGYQYLQFKARWLGSNQSYDDFYLAEAAYTLEGNVDYATAAIPTANIGEGAFQYSQDAVDAANALVQGEATVEAVEAAYEAVTTINEPGDGQLFNVILTYEGWGYDQKAMTFIANGRNDAGLYNIQYKEGANVNLAQAFTFTKVSGNNYKMSQIDADGNVRYLSTGVPYGGNTAQIRTTTDESQALVVTVIPTATEGKWNLRNTEANQYIGSQDAGVYTVNSHIDFNIVETQKPSITINTTAAGWGTTILPFAVSEIPDGVKVYSCAEVSGSTLTLVQVETLEANKPYIIEGAWSETLTGDAQGTSLSNTEGLLTGTYVSMPAIDGTYVLQKNDGKVGFYRVNLETAQPTVGANRAYLTVPATDSEARAFFLGGETTGINALEALAGGEAQIFNVNGVQQPRLVKGLNIIVTKDGKTHKVMVK